MFKRSLICLFSLMLLICFSGVFASATDYQEVTVQADVFADVGGNLHGLAFDREGNMYVGCYFGLKIVKITPDGKTIPFAEMGSIGTPEAGNAHIWDLTFGPDNILYAAARDRLLKITPEGKISTYIKGDYSGSYGTVCIRIDSKGNIYVSFENKVVRYDSSLNKTVLIDGEKEKKIQIEHVIGIELDANEKDLYVYESYYGQILKCSLKADGSRDELSVLFSEPDYSGEYISKESDRIILKGPDYDYFYLIDKKGVRKVNIESPGEKITKIQMFKFNKSDKNIIYGTSYNDGKVYRINLEQLSE